MIDPVGSSRTFGFPKTVPCNAERFFCFLIPEKGVSGKEGLGDVFLLNVCSFSVSQIQALIVNMLKKLILLLLLAALLVTGGYFFWKEKEEVVSDDVTVYGNVDLRQIDSAFLISERLSAVYVDEGQTVKKGQKLAELETVRLGKELEAARMAGDAAWQNFQKVKNGPRKEDIARARASVEAATAAWENAKVRRDRLVPLSRKQSVSVQQADDATAMETVTGAYVNVKQKELDLLLAGSREEDILQAEAEWKRAVAECSIRQQRLDDAVLYAPCNAVVRNRILEPGDMASPQKPVFNLAVMDVKWIRAYLTEKQLGKVRPGMEAMVTNDSFSGRQFNGTVGFISSVAEFTPKNVETPELRTALVYEVRIIVQDPDNCFRLGAPATVTIRVP